MGILDLCSELQAGEGLAEMILLRTNHDEHECLRIAAQGELEQVGKLLFEILALGQDVIWESLGQSLHTLLFLYGI